MVVKFYKEDYLTLLHTKYKTLGLMVSEKKAFVCFSLCKYTGDNDPQGVAILTLGA